jgi:hypothetical protein
MPTFTGILAISHVFINAIYKNCKLPSILLLWVEMFQ